MKYLSIIDPHCHLRGQEYANTDYMHLAAEDAKAVGLAGVIEMPNPQPWITTPEIVGHRREVWRMKSEAYHNCHIGMTTDIDQCRMALGSAQARRNGMLYSDKTFFVHSTGSMGVLDPEYQRLLWRTKVLMGYTGVSIGHFESERAYGSRGIQFDPKDPCTHSLYQGEDAELEQVMAQLLNATDEGFAGTFYIAHVSNPETVRAVEAFRKSPIDFKIVLEITWHHMLLNFSDYVALGNNLKCNPPVRSQRVQEELLDMVLNGRFDIISTDHAPHPPERKTGDKPASGVPGLPFWPRGIALLKGAGISQTLLDNMTFHNANRLFDLMLEPREVEMNEAEICASRGRFVQYGFNPFERLYYQERL